MSAPVTVNVSGERLQRSSTPGKRPASLPRGQEFVNFTDKVRLVGTGAPVVDLPEYPLKTEAELAASGPIKTALDGKADAAALAAKADASSLAGKANQSDLLTHTGNTSNPHGTTAAQVGAYSTSQSDALLGAKLDKTAGGTVAGQTEFTQRPTFGGAGLALSSEVVAGTFLGSWDASTNTPTLTTTPGGGAPNAAYYVVSVAGTQSVTGASTAFNPGDTLRSTGSAWQRVPNFVDKATVGLGNVANAAQLEKTNNLSDLPSKSAARGNLGLGDSATRSVGTAPGSVAAGDDSRITGAAQLNSANTFSQDQAVRYAPGYGYVALHSGTTGPESGSVSFHYLDGTRQGYIGSGDVDGNPQIVAEAGKHWNFSGNAPTISGATIATTADVSSAVSGKADASTLSAHTGNTSNPHGTSAAQVGAYTYAQVDAGLATKVIRPAYLALKSRADVTDYFTIQDGATGASYATPAILGRGNRVVNIARYPGNPDSAFADLVDGSTLDVPAGTFLITPKSLAGKSISIRGDGPGVSILKKSGSGTLLAFDNSSYDQSKKVNIQDLSLITTGTTASNDIALAIKYPTVLSENRKGPLIRNVEIKGESPGEPSPGVRGQAWGYGLYLQNCWSTTVDGLHIQFAEEYPDQGTAILLLGHCTPVMTRNCVQTWGYRFLGLSDDAGTNFSEGFIASENQIVGTTIGYDLSGSHGAPLAEIRGGHVNSYLYGVVSGGNRNSVNVSNVTFYKWKDRPNANNWRGVWIQDGGEWSVEGCKFYGYKGDPNVGSSTATGLHNDTGGGGTAIGNRAIYCDTVIAAVTVPGTFIGNSWINSTWVPPCSGSIDIGNAAT